MELAPDTRHNNDPWTIAVEWARPWHRPVLCRPTAARSHTIATVPRPTGRSIAAGRDLLRSQFPIGWSSRYF